MISFENFKKDCFTVVESLKNDLKLIRTGRASSAVIESVIVETYGGQTKLKLMELATIINSDPKTLLITPFDSSTLPDIEKAILKSPLGLQPITSGQQILLKFPPLTGEQREKYIKLANAKVEERKNQLRNLRDEARKKIKTAFEQKEISEDERYRHEKQIDEITQQYMEEIQRLKENKEKEIKEI